MRVRQQTPLPPPPAADLEAQVAARTRDLESARAELEARSRHNEEVDRLKNAFIANMSHEIRTPLNSVLALTELLRDGVAGPLTIDQRKYLQVIERNGQALLHLINDVLDLSRIETGHLEMDAQDVDLAPQVELVTAALAPLAAAKNLDLMVKLPPSLPAARGDVDRFRQILTNLIGNAIKFTEGGGQILIGAEVGPDTVTVVVTDTGVGIPDAYREKIFEEFVQVDQTLARRQGGTGLGLAIARRLARLMGGEIEVESVLSRGSRFSLSLPRAAEAKASAASSVSNVPTTATAELPPGQPLAGAAPPVPVIPATVLVVEDNEDNLFTLRQILARRPLAIVTATSGRQAIERCRVDPPDLVIMDVQMPGMTGLQATGAIRALPGGADIPIVALTAQAMKGDRERILAAGCDAYLAKPVQPNELIAVVERLLRDGASGATISSPAAPPAGAHPDQSTGETPDGAHTPRR
ncbi:MAG TPA: ATP-binding protein [Polyangia bacterium]|jgi:signal transduction histidine kinase/DNA-binding NarL/FixJ family response regulator|nr:ATP-binding protein [Polyangia bacterium]